MIQKKHRRWIIYLICCLLFSFSQFYRSSIAVISPNLVEELSLDAKDLGLISAAFFYAFAAMQIPVGFYLDSIGPRVLMTVLSLVAVAGATLFAFGDSAMALIAGRLLMGVGMACNLMGPLKLVTTWFSPLYFATLSAILVSIGTAGNIAAATPLVWLTEWFGWRTTFLLFAMSNLVIAILFFMIAKDRPEEPDRESSGQGGTGWFTGWIERYPASVFPQGLLADFDGNLFPLRHLCIGSIPLGRPFSDGQHGAIPDDDRQPAAGHEHRPDHRQSRLRMDIRFGFSFKESCRYCRIGDDGGKSDHPCRVVYRRRAAAPVCLVFWFWIFQWLRPDHVRAHQRTNAA